MAENTRVALYARYSTDMQSDASINDQFRLCSLRSSKEGWSVTLRYEDRATSGASLLRNGIQSLLSDALAGKFDIVLCEALDRLSRDQEDIAGIYKRLSFAGVKIITLSEGEVSDLHIGLKGTMNALFLKDLADKTRRGLRGRVEAGKSAGGIAYGYDVVKEFDANNGPLKGKRTINAHEAEIINRIFEEYASGKSPRAIAHDLNSEDISGPRTKNWSPSTIYGNRHRGTGIINNELYIGRLVWNRLRYVKNPDTGKRISKLNPESDWVIEQIPTLRVVDQSLWNSVKTKQKKLDGRKEKQTYWKQQRPKHLLTGLVKCGTCGGNYTKINKALFGCATSRNKGLSVCDNRTNIRVDDLDNMILDSLKGQLMAPALFEEFAKAFVKEVNTLRSSQTNTRKAQEAELQRLEKQIRNIIEAIKDGLATSSMKAELHEMDARKVTLTENLAMHEDEQPLLHPAMAQIYRDKVANLADALIDDQTKPEAFEAIRGLVDKIALTPSTNGLDIKLTGDIASIMEIASNTPQTNKAPSIPARDFSILAEQVKVVAGVGFEPTTFRL